MYPDQEAILKGPRILLWQSAAEILHALPRIVDEETWTLLEYDVVNFNHHSSPACGILLSKEGIVLYENNQREW